MRKFIFYIKNLNRPIIITEKDENKIESKDFIETALSNKKTVLISTLGDTLGIRPENIVAIHIIDEKKDPNDPRNFTVRPTIEKPQENIVLNTSYEEESDEEGIDNLFNEFYEEETNIIIDENPLSSLDTKNLKKDEE